MYTVYCLLSKLQTHEELNSNDEQDMTEAMPKKQQQQQQQHTYLKK
jgi:hypothetical protein